MTPVYNVVRRENARNSKRFMGLGHAITEAAKNSGIISKRLKK
jgi:hypothetical protein